MDPFFFLRIINLLNRSFIVEIIVQSHRTTMENECQRNFKTGALIGPNRSQGDLMGDSRLKAAPESSAAELVGLMLCIDTDWFTIHVSTFPQSATN